MEKKVIVGWPQSQMIREKQGFYENCMLINSIEGVLSYGADAFLVDKDWYDKFFNGELEDMTEEEIERRAEELEVCYDNSIIFAGRVQ